MIRIGVLKVITNLVWALCWKTNIRSLYDWSTDLWCIQQTREANWIARRVYHGSDWHGLNGRLEDGTDVVTTCEVLGEDRVWRNIPR